MGNIKSKYSKIAVEIFEYIGGKSNQVNLYNCMTRLRIKILNKDLVNTEKIKSLDIVKGIVWNGDELQIIIGGEVYKVKEECLKILDNNEGLSKANNLLTKDRTPISKKIMPAITAIVFPTIPILIGGGIIGGLQSILVISGALQNPTAGQSVADLNMWSAIMYVASKVGLEMIGVVFLVSTVRYLKGDIFLALFLALGLTSRYFMGDGWELFKLFGQPIVIKSYEGTVLPMVSAGFLIYFIDKWVKKWMPTQVDVVFRPAIVFFLSLVIMLFTVGPFFRIIEQFIAKFVILMGNLPLGMGVGILALIWQPLVLTGTHVAVVTAITLPMNNIPSEPSAMYAALQIAIMGQIGASIAVLLKTKNFRTKQAVIGGLPGSIFGITEPLIYGINLPKIKPFLFGCVGGLVGGLVAGASGVAQAQRTGTGIMSWLGLNSPTSIVMGILSGFIALGVALLITLVFYFDRKDEKREYSKISKIMQSDYNLNFDQNLILDEIKSFDFNKYENLLIKLQKQETQLKQFSEKYDELSLQYSNKIEKAKLKNDIQKIDLLNNKFLDFEKSSQNKLLDLENTINSLKEEISVISKKYNEHLSKIYDESALLLKEEPTKFLIPKIYNSLFSLEIFYEIRKPQDQIKNLNNKNKIFKYRRNQ